MMTVYGYGFEEPQPVVEEPQGPGLMTYALIAGALYLAWTQGWFKKALAAGKSTVAGGEQQ